MKKIILFLSLIIILLTVGSVVLASCDLPTGTISADKPEVGANEPFKITVAGWDDNDILKLFVCYYDSNNKWVCQEDKFYGGGDRYETKSWTFSLSAPGAYVFYGSVLDSDKDGYGCLENHMVSTNPESVQVIVKQVSNVCQDLKCGINLEPSCLCGNTPIEYGEVCCASYNNGGGKAFDNPTTCLTQCPGVLIPACKPDCEDNSDLSGPTCLCGDEVIVIKDKPYCCPKLETGYKQQETCQGYCEAALPSCDNSFCQAAETQDCLCGNVPIEAGEYCCAASDKGYSKQNLCQADLKCQTAKSCNDLYGTWCPVNNSCEGTDLTSEASDSSSHSDQICCLGECEQPAQTPPGTTPPGTTPPGDTTPPPGDTTPPPGTTPPGTTPPGGSTQSGEGGIDNPLRYKSFKDLASAVNNFIFILAIALAPILFVIGGLMIVTAGGNPLQVQKAQKIMLYTAIGLIVILLAQAFVAVLRNMIGVKEATTYFPLIFSSLGLELKKKGRISFLN